MMHSSSYSTIGLCLLACSRLAQSAAIANPAINIHQAQAHEDNTRPTVHLSCSSNVVLHGNVTTDGIESFLNIHFGHDTSGQHRFAPPRAYKYEENSTVDASRPGAACPQPRIPVPGFPVFDPVTSVSEDCLTLRVDRPVGTRRDAKLPVMVYIYGGGDTIGQIYDGAYNPAGLVSNAARNGVPIIYAAMNYRVGIFGFAASAALDKADSLNVGLLDQRLGLEWIKENIASFGGDPSRITIFGESVGATSVGLQITAYGDKTQRAPFKRAIMQSGGPTADAGTASNISAIRTAAVAHLANCTSTPDERQLACLRDLPWARLQNISYEYAQTVAPPFAFDVFLPTSPSSFIPDSPSRLLRSGRFARGIEMISGWNENDGSLFVPTNLSSSADTEKFLAASFPRLTAHNIQRSLDLYPPGQFQPLAKTNLSSEFFRASQMERDLAYMCPSVLMVQSNAVFSRGSAGYLYALNDTVFARFYDAIHTPYYGVSHFSDIPFVFDQAATRFGAIASPEDKVVSSQMSASWAEFASSGQPVGRNGTLSDWPRAITPHGQLDHLLVIGGPRAGPGKVKDYENLLERCAFWNSPGVLEELTV